MKDTSHLVVLQERLYRERTRLAEAKNEKEKQFRQVQVEQAQKEIKGEMEFLGMKEGSLPEMSDDELLAELTA